jgi:hypothetical protein
MGQGEIRWRWAKARKQWLHLGKVCGIVLHPPLSNGARFFHFEHRQRAISRPLNTLSIKNAS